MTDDEKQELNRRITMSMYGCLDGPKPDWLGDEKASAMLLDEMPEPMEWREDDGWFCRPDWRWPSGGGTVKAPDRKLARALAWLKLKET